MNKLNMSTIVRSIRASMKKHSPEILTGLGIAGMVVTTVMAVKATPKALKLIEQKKEEKETDKLTPIAIIKTAWLCYIPSVIMGSVSICCLIGASSVNLRRNAALAAAYTLSEDALKDYREKVVEVLGDKKEQTIRDEVAKDKVNKNPVANSEVIIVERGNTLCYDSISGRYFKSDIDKIKKAVNDLNRQMRDEMYISLNEFYYEIGLSGTKIGEDIGWNIEKGYIDINFSSQLTEDSTPCLVLDYSLAPCYEYN